MTTKSLSFLFVCVFFFNFCSDQNSLEFDRVNCCETLWIYEKTVNYAYKWIKILICGLYLKKKNFSEIPFLLSHIVNPPIFSNILCWWDSRGTLLEEVQKGMTSLEKTVTVCDILYFPFDQPSHFKIYSYKCEISHI